MKLYREVLIESVEQAEALPEGTFVPRANGRLPKKRKDGTWGDLWGDCGLFDILTWTAYVPIEAEEEWGLFQDDEGTMDLYADEAEAREWARIDGEGRAPSRRLVTPWEEA